MIDIKIVRSFLAEKRILFLFGIFTQVAVYIFYFFLIRGFFITSGGELHLIEIVAVTLPLASLGLLARQAFRGNDSYLGLILMLICPLAISEGSLFIILTSLSCLVVGFILGKYAKTRHHLIMLAVMGSLVQIIIGTSLWNLLVGMGGTGKIFIASLYSLITGPGFLVLLLFIGEEVFALSTDLKLIDLCSESSTLMRMLREKAPGTFFHSMNTAFIAEEGALALGGDVLLCRSGGMYHDLGKIWKPEYYSENQYEAVNIHENISEDLSRLIIISHIDEGIKLARKHRLGREIEDIIKKHHGNSPIYYYEERSGRTSDRYPGPKPGTREQAIVMLADGVEATARSIRNITEKELMRVVEFVLKRALKDGQLEDADFDERDVHILQEAFCRSLKIIFHNRVYYPSKDGYWFGGGEVENLFEEFKEGQEGKDESAEKDDKGGPGDIKYH